MTFAPTARVNDIAADCAREPIHIPGGIQPHGFLFSIDAAGLIVQASGNVGELVGAPVDSLLGKPLQQILGKTADTILSALATLSQEGAPLYVGSMADPRHGGGAARPPFAVVVHRFGGVAIVELEPARDTTDVSSSIYPLVRAFMSGLAHTDSVGDLARLAAREIRSITGYGRTLVYDFDDEGNGHVVAEALDDGYASYLDQRFPGSDIPAQARALYLTNRIRLIADADYEFVPLVPAAHPSTGRPTDLTHASLRSVSPVHVQYMKNMGTWSSMSMSIVVDGKLWGLISCHHATPRVPPFEVRTACDHIAQVLSLQIEATQDRAESERRLELRRRLSGLLSAMTTADHFVDALAADPAALLGLTDATGAAIVIDGRTVVVGACPAQSTIDDLVVWLDAQTEDVFSTDNLAAAWERPVAPESAGVLVLSISKLFRNYVIWFRAEVVRTIKWAGDPRAKLSALSDRLSPRTSFDAWTETVRGRARPWSPAELEIAGEFRTALLGIVLRRAEELAQLAVQLGRANQELEGFSYTVSHDLRAPLRHIVGFAELLSETEGDRLSERGTHFVERIVSAARFGGRLVDDLLAFAQLGRAALQRQPVDLQALAEQLAASERKEAPGRAIEWKIGPLVKVVADPLLLNVVLRNLIANAVKFTRNRSTPEAPAIIEIGSEAGRGELAGQDVIFVRDNGVGFDMRYVDKLFGVFQRLHRFEEFEGTGIGLATVRRIVERHGGRTWAEGETERGATIWFSLPRVPAAAPAEAKDTPAGTLTKLRDLASATPFDPVRKDP